MKKKALTSILLGGSISLAQAVGIFAPGDAVVGGISNGTDFVTGSEGFGFNQWPGAEPPSAAIDGTTSKYLNFGEEGSGLIVTPTSGASIARQITLWTANDAIERDPTTVSIFGTNDSIAVSSNPLASFTAIALDLPLSLPAGRNTDTLLPENSQSVGFDNSTSYTSYLIIFPTVDNAIAANSMQIGEIQLDTEALIPEPGSTSLLLLGFGAIACRRKR